MRIDTHHLEMIVAIAKEGTITAAARALFVTQPALSRRLSKLEKSLQVPLFHRSGGRMVISPAGERVLGSALVILEELRGAERDLSRMKTRPGPVVRVGSPGGLFDGWLAAVIRGFQRRFPDHEVQLVRGSASDHLEAITRGEIDLAMACAAEDLPDSVSSREILRDELVAIVRRGHALAARAYLEAADFDDVHLVLYSRDPDLRFLPPGLLERAALVTEMDVPRAVLEMVRDGRGVSVLPGWAVGHTGVDGLATLRITQSGLFRRWHAVVPKEKDDLASTHFVGVAASLLRSSHGAALELARVSDA